MQTFYHQDSSVIDSMMYSQFIKYEKLYPVARYVAPKQPPYLINIFIDLYSMVTPLFRFYRFEDPLSLTACIINLAIHYRNLFKKLGVYSNIFIIYSHTMSHNNLRYCPEYNQTHIMNMLNNRDVKQLLDDNLELSKHVIKFLPDIYFRQGTVEVPVIITDMIIKFKEKGYNVNSLVVSRSPISFQIPCFSSKTTVLCLRSNKEIMTVNMDNCLSKAVEYNGSDRDVGNMYQFWLSGYFTLSRLGKRDLKSLCSTSVALKILKAMQSNNETLNAESLYNYYLIIKGEKQRGVLIDRKDLMTKIFNRFMCLDFNHQLALYRNMPESKETGYLSQMQDQVELFNLNTKYFRSNPMNLDML